MFSLLFALLVIGFSFAAVLLALTVVAKITFKILVLPILIAVFVVKAAVLLALGVVLVAVLIPVAIVIGLLAAPFALVGVALA
jgi:hypothetical protein